ncbi:MAG TPA: protein kinase [Thermoanaerobaculia bacterium]|nr:protein kinase [Thermoanaerobaculia bacterium]
MEEPTEPTIVEPAGVSHGAAAAEETTLSMPAAGGAPAGDRGHHPGASPGGSAWIGRTVSRYRILELLGGGGMGLVYKAEDMQLQRSVALKFLPPELTRDPVAKVRFLQEARAASALDHPNICTVHDIGETAGDEQLFIAMSCYRGATLRKRLAAGPLPLPEVVDLGRQICYGLAEAHRHGIVHRDIKPANLMVTADGIVKILDFGIAKLAGEAAITRVGSTLGTPGYMSPEQALGREVDARTDLWSLGAVLYEMVAGRLPFRGENHQAMLYSLLNAEPEPLARLRPEVPPGLERVVARLLARDPLQRYQSADELAGALAALSLPADGAPPGHAAPGHATPGHAAAVAAPAAIAAPGETTRQPPLPYGPRVVNRRRWLAAGAAAAAALLAAAGLLLLRARGGPAAPPAGTGAPLRATFTQLTDLPGSESFPSVSPDGSYFLYTKSEHANSDIYLQRIGGGNPIDLTADSPQADTQPAFSPDGQQIAFRSERDGGGIFLMGATGESVRRLTDFGYNPAWSPDGTEIVCATEGVSSPTARTYTSQLWRVNVATGAKRLVTEGDAVQPSWSPHGLRIAFWGIPAGSARRVLWTIPADRPGPVGSGEAAPVLDDAYVDWSPAWAPDGSHLYFASDRSGAMNLWRVPIDEATGKALGEPEPLATPSRSSGLPSVSRDGRRILFATRDGKANLERLAFDPAAGRVAGTGEALTQGSRLVKSCAASPDGRWIAFYSLVPQENLFVIHPDGSGLRQLTNERFKDRNPRWSPDGSRLAFYSNRSGRYELWTIRPDGGGLEQVTHSRGPFPLTPLWSPDGRKLACYLFGRSTALVDLTRPPAQRQPIELPAAGGKQLRFAATSWSPDGRWLAGYLEQPSGSPIPGIVLYSFQSAGYSRLTERGTGPIWLHDSRRLLYRDDGKLSLLDTGSRKAAPLLEPPAHSAFDAMCTSPDDHVLYVVRETDEGHIWMLTTG